MIKNENEKQKIHGKKRKSIVMISTLFALLMLITSFAWYAYYAKRSLNTQETQIRVPYYLYLLETDMTDYFSFEIINLHPEETKQVVFCVSNRDKQGTTAYHPGRETTFDYELELAYTQNMPVTYTLYEVEPDEIQDGEVHEDDAFCVDGTWWKKKYGNLNPSFLNINEKKSIQITKDNNIEMYGENWESIINRVNYNVYTLDTRGLNPLNLSVTQDDEGMALYDYDYYMLEINWKEDANYVDYLKETDLIYVKVNAIQTRPEL